jgi:hypothetical protein
LWINSAQSRPQFSGRPFNVDVVSSVASLFAVDTYRDGVISGYQIYLPLGPFSK